MPTPHYFKRLTKRLLLSFGGLTAAGVGITSTIDLYGLNEQLTEAMQWSGGIMISVGLVGGIVGPWVANLVYEDDNTNKQ